MKKRKKILLKKITVSKLTNKQKRTVLGGSIEGPCTSIIDVTEETAKYC